MMSEKILAIKRVNLPDAWLVEKGFVQEEIFSLEKLLKVIEWYDRDLAEINEAIKQIIPYVIIKSSIDGNIAYYQRKGSERRIHGLHSVGVGGHVNPEDFIKGDSFDSFIRRSARRELFEEFKEISPIGKMKFIGVINEELTKVGRTHIALVFIPSF